MGRAENIAHELHKDGDLDRAIWDVTRWLTHKGVSYNLPEGASLPIIEGWEARGINKRETRKYREWEALTNKETALKAELSSLIRKDNEQESQNPNQEN